MKRRSFFQMLLGALGFAGVGKIAGVLKSQPRPPKTFFVGSVGSDVPGNGLTVERPFASLRYALEQCEPGDTVVGISVPTEALPVWGLDADSAKSTEMVDGYWIDFAAKFRSMGAQHETT